jgi:hypothetical protein
MQKTKKMAVLRHQRPEDSKVEAGAENTENTGFPCSVPRPPMSAPDDLLGGVPHAVVREVERMLADAQSAPERELIGRLRTDPRMRRVWRRLERCAVLDGVRNYCLLFRKALPEDHCSDHDLALARFVFSAYFLAHHGVEVRKVSELDAEVEPHRAAAHRLRDEAAKMRKRCFGPRMEFYASVLEYVAAYCDSWAENMLVSAQPLLVVRDHGRRRARGFCIELTAEAVRLFGKPMPSTIATVASVALGEPVAMQTVRKWCP